MRDRRTDPASLTTGFDQPRRVGGSGSGARSLPRRTVVVGQKARDGSAGRTASAGASLRTAMGTTQPIAAMQAKVIPLHGFCAGCCCCSIIFMQSSDIPDIVVPVIAIGADTAGGADAKATSWPSRPIRAPRRRKRRSALFTTVTEYASHDPRATPSSSTVAREDNFAASTKGNDIEGLGWLPGDFHAW